MQKISTSQPGQEPDGDRDFPRTTPPAKDASHSASSFPVPLTPIIGRERELELAQAKLKQPEVRLLTLIGSPGVGKTRLSLELATRLEKSFAQGMYFVSLASVFDPQLVMPAIGRAVHLSHKDTASSLERLQVFFEHKHALMLLDNFEQVLLAAPQLVELLTSCPRLKLVITSRAALQIGGEYELVINPLALPEPLKYPSPDDLAHVASVALFLQRIEAVKPEFQLTKANAPLVSKLCQKLAGVPLAIELAAARSKVLSLQAISSRLEQGLTVLSGSRQDAPVRHHSLHDTINWSYQLLSADEQALFRSLSVFAGTFTLDAAEHVTAFTGLPSVSMLDGISSLIDKSMLQKDEYDGSDLLLHQLDTIRQFGMDQLIIHDELADCRKAHATYYLALAEQASKAWHGPGEARWVHVLELEYENVQVALAYFQEQNKHVELLRLVTAIGFFWFYRGYLNEGRHYLEQALAHNLTTETSEDALLRANALQVAAVMAFWQNDTSQAYSWIEESEHLYQQSGEERGLARALLMSGLLKRRLLYTQEGDSILKECLQLCRHTGNDLGLTEILNALGFIAYYDGEYDRAEQMLTESQELSRKLGNGYTLAQNLYFMAKIAFVQGDYQRAYPFSEESLRLFEASYIPLHLPKGLTLHALISLTLGDKTTTTDLLNKAYIRSEEIQDLEDKAAVLHCQGLLAQSLKEHTRAYALFEESMKSLLPMNMQKAGLNSWVLPANLEGLGIVAFEQGNLTRCVSLFSLADITRQTMTYDIFFKPCYFLYHHLMKEIKQALGEEKFATAWTIGQEMTLQQALGLITQETHDIYSDFPKKTPLKPFSSIEQLAPIEELTQREVEVLRLIANGLSNNSIAEQLVVSPHTVNRHTQSIYQKLGVKSRSAATRYAFEHDLQ